MRGFGTATYCKDIYEWFSYMVVAGLQWDTATTEDIERGPSHSLKGLAQKCHTRNAMETRPLKPSGLFW
jgi:hypothetical protein